MAVVVTLSKGYDLEYIWKPVVVDRGPAKDAAGYYLQRYELDFSTRGVVQGASYTDVKAQLPALQLLIFISFFAFILLIYNISESNLVRPGIMWVLLIIASTALAKLATQRKPVVAKRWRYGGFQRPSPGGAAR